MPSQIKVDEIKNVAGQYEIKTNTFKGQTTGGSIAVQGEGSATTNLQQGLCKAWVQGSSDTTFRDSFNAGSGTDNGTGDYTYTFTNNMANDDYVCSGLVIDVSPRFGNIAAIATGSFTIQYHHEGGGSRDVDNTTTIHGDLA